MRLVVKIGTSSLCTADGQFQSDRLAGLCQQLVELRMAGVEIILVSSGAVGAGIGHLGIQPASVVHKQALAAVGQALLMQAYGAYLGDVCIAQVLLTRTDLEESARRLSSQSTLEQLLGWGVIPIINENDTVADEELRIGDNDTLAARVAVLLRSDCLILLSDVNGLYTGDPRGQARVEIIPSVNWVSPEHLQQFGHGAGQWGTGGMLTKLQAAMIAQAAGIPMVLAHSGHPHVLADIVQGRSDVGTRFLARKAQKVEKEREIPDVAGAARKR